MTNAHTDGEALIPLDRDLFEPATDSTAQDDTQTPDTPGTQNSAPAEPVIDGHGSFPEGAAPSPDGEPLTHLDRSFFSRATSEPETVAHTGHQGHLPHGSSGPGCR